MYNFSVWDFLSRVAEVSVIYKCLIFEAEQQSTATANITPDRLVALVVSTLFSPFTLRWNACAQLPTSTYFPSLFIYCHLITILDRFKSFDFWRRMLLIKYDYRRLKIMIRSWKSSLSELSYLGLDSVVVWCFDVFPCKKEDFLLWARNVCRKRCFQDKNSDFCTFSSLICLQR